MVDAYDQMQQGRCTWKLIAAVSTYIEPVQAKPDEILNRGEKGDGYKPYPWLKSFWSLTAAKRGRASFSFRV